MPVRPTDEKSSIAFWTTTILGPASFVIGGVLELQRGPEVVATLNHLGYPVYFAAILGTWKLLGAIVIRYSISAALWIATALSALCSAALFRSSHTSDKL